VDQPVHLRADVHGAGPVEVMVLLFGGQARELSGLVQGLEYPRVALGVFEALPGVVQHGAAQGLHAVTGAGLGPAQLGALTDVGVHDHAGVADDGDALDDQALGDALASARYPVVLVLTWAHAGDAFVGRVGPHAGVGHQEEFMGPQ
jgi:hypothetical protein